MERKPISKKKRFDIFKRDYFACQYCGKNPPNVILEVDHIIPVCKGGTNDDDNLLTSCFDCNRGKGGREMTSLIQNTTDKVAILKEKQQQYKLFKKLLDENELQINELINKIDDIYQQYHGQCCLTDRFKQGSVRMFLNKIPFSDVANAMHKACGKISSSSYCVKYFCGICWNIIKEKGRD